MVTNWIFLVGAVIGAGFGFVLPGRTQAKVWVQTISSNFATGQDVLSSLFAAEPRFHKPDQLGIQVAISLQ
jgi:hypothetical protein